MPAGLPASMQEAIHKAQANHPGTAAAVFSERAAADNIDLQFAALLPSIDLQARLHRQYSRVSRPSSSGGAPNRIDSSAIVAQLTIPLYSQGKQESMVRQARYAHGQKRIQVEAQRRQAIQSAVQAWQSLVTARAAITSFQVAVRAGKMAVEGLQQEVRVGSRTVLDVLTEQQNLLDPAQSGGGAAQRGDGRLSASCRDRHSHRARSGAARQGL